MPVAERTEPAAPVSQPPPKYRQIEEIVVTAQKRESSIQDAPFSVSALSGDAMQSRGVASAADLQFQVAGLNVSEGTSATLISIRGVGTNVDAGATEPAVAVHIDGVYQPRPSTGPLGLNDLERVEVLKGPQGTLYGRNSTGGVINYILKAPTDEFEGSLRLGVANFEKRSVAGILSGPLVDGVLKGRVLAEWDQDGGYVRDLRTGETTDDRKGYGGRVALSWLVAEPFKVDLSLLYRSDEGGAITPRDVCLALPNPDNEIALGMVPTAVVMPDACPTDDPHTRKTNHEPWGERETLNGALTATWDLESLTLKSMTGYQTHDHRTSFDYDAMARDVLWITEKHDTSNALSEELTASGLSFDDRLQWLVGGFYFRSEYTPDLYVDVPSTGGGLKVHLKEEGKTDSIAAFTDLTWSLTDRVRLGGGLRVLKDKKSALQTNQYGFAGGAVPAPGSIPGVITECENAPVELEFKKVTPKLNAQWDVLDNASAYATYAVGFQSGGTNFSSCGDTYEPEKNVSVEVGLKSSWFDRRLVGNVALFHTNYDNFQILKIEGLAANVINAPKAEITGADIELTAVLTEQLVANAAVSILDAVYKEFSDNDPVNADAGEQDLAGRQLIRSPDYTVNLGAEYTWNLPFKHAANLRLRGEWYKTAGLVFRPFNDPNDGQEGYSLFNTFLSLSNADETLALNAYVKNLTDTEYFLFKAANSFGNRFGTAGEPRRFGAEFIYRFH